MDICREIYAVIQSNLDKILALRYTGKLKSDRTFVSEGDILCESLIMDFLKQNVKDYLLISEESYHDTARKDTAEYVITIDPIDGTENFVSGLKEWGTGISIYKHGVHHQSMIALPELNICLCTGDNIDRVPRSRICGLSSYMTPSDFNGLGDDMEFRIMGCCMYNMFNVIHGSYKRFRHTKGCYSWDILPGLNLALEHGLTAIVENRPYHGEFLMPDIKYRFTIE